MQAKRSALPILFGAWTLIGGPPSCSPSCWGCPMRKRPEFANARSGLSGPVWHVPERICWRSWPMAVCLNAPHTEERRHPEKIEPRGRGTIFSAAPDLGQRPTFRRVLQREAHRPASRRVFFAEGTSSPTASVRAIMASVPTTSPGA